MRQAISAETVTENEPGKPGLGDWDAFVDRSPQGVLFCRTWWLDAVAPGRYEIVTVRKGNEIQAGWPVVWPESGGRGAITMPLLTQKLGILLAPFQGKYAEGLSTEHRLIEELLERLPPAVHLDQRFHENFTNWLPFYWRGYQQTTRYTYVLDDLSDLDALWQRMRNTVRTEVRKAEKLGVRVRENDDLEYFYRLNCKTFERQRLRPPYDLAVLGRIEAAARTGGGRKILIAEGPDGRAHACAFLVYDRNCAFLLLTGADEQLRGSGAGSLLTWELIRFAATVSKRFDFEGSMLRAVEPVYRGFGGKQTPYFRIWGRRQGHARSPLRHLAGRALRKFARMLDPTGR